MTDAAFFSNYLKFPNKNRYRAVTAVTDGFVPIFWRTVDDAADSLIDGVVGLGDYMPGWAGGPEPAIVLFIQISILST